MAGLQQRQTEGNQEAIRAVLYDEMNSCYALWYLESISLNTHRRVSNTAFHPKQLKQAKKCGNDTSCRSTLTIGCLVVRPLLPLLLNSGGDGLVPAKPGGRGGV